MRHRLLVLILRHLGARILWLWCKSLRFTIQNDEHLEQLRNNSERYIMAFWHGSMFVGWFLHRPKYRESISALVSRSKDGEFLSAVLESWNYVMIRGSSHIGGKEAMQLMTDAVQNGSSLAITPDGPTGPKHVMKMGAVRLSQKTRVPLFLCGITMDKVRRLKSWDAFEVPKPFSKVTVRYSDPIFVPKDLQGESLDHFLAETEKKLKELHSLPEEGQ